MLIQAAHGAKLKRGSFYRNKYNKLKFKLGSANKAKVAIANRLARTIFKVLGGASFKDLGYCRAVEHEDKIRTPTRAGPRRFAPKHFVTL